MASAQGKYFPSQTSGEEIFLLVRRHPIIFIGMSFFMVVLLVPVVVLVFYWFFSPEIFAGALGNFLIVFSSMYTLVVLGLMLYGFVNYYLDVYIVTNERIIDIRQHGLFHREIAELHLHQVQDIEAQVDGFFQTMFHYGNIHIQTAGEDKNFVFQDVPHPYSLSKKIIELHRAQLESDRPLSEESSQRENQPQGNDVDDFRPEEFGRKTSDLDQQQKSDLAREEAQDEESEGGIRDLEANYFPGKEHEIEDQLEKKYENNSDAISDTPEEVGFGAKSDSAGKENEQKLSELSEGEEVNLDDKG